MRAKYARAIRQGILLGQKTRYGDVDDPYYKLRSEIIYGYGEWDLRALAIKSFEHTWKTESATRMQDYTEEERAEAQRIFEYVYELHTESRVEKQIRLFREEVQVLAKKVHTLEEK